MTELFGEVHGRLRVRVDTGTDDVGVLMKSLPESLEFGHQPCVTGESPSGKPVFTDQDVGDQSEDRKKEDYQQPGHRGVWPAALRHYGDHRQADEPIGDEEPPVPDEIPCRGT